MQLLLPTKTDGGK